MSKHNQASFWKKHQTLLQKCADLTDQCGVKILCVITVPDEYSPTPVCKQHTLGFNAQSVHLSNSNGTTVVFDSFSTKEERTEWKPFFNSVSKLNDTSRHFSADWSVRVSSRLSAVLGPEDMAAYRTVDQRGSKPVDSSKPVGGTAASNGAAAIPFTPLGGTASIPFKPPGGTAAIPLKPGTPAGEPNLKRAIIATDFDEEIQELKRHCATLTSGSSNQQQRRSMAEALLSMNQTPGSFAAALRGNQSPQLPGNDELSSQRSDTSTVCSGDDFRVAVSALCAFGRMA